MYMHAYTLYSFVRPFGCSVLLSGFEDGQPQLFSIDPSGVCFVSSFFKSSSKISVLVQCY